jgi:hypothetical protein
LPSEDRDDHVLSWEGSHIVLDGGFVDFHARDKDTVAMKFFIGLQSQSLCLTA